MKGSFYRVSDLNRLIAESSTNSEFKPVLGPNVEKDNKANNGKAYKDAEKRAKDFDGGLTEKPNKTKLYPKADSNRTTLDYNLRVEPTKEWKEKVEAQAKGYTSKMEQDNGIEKAAEFDNDGRIYKQFKDSNDEAQEARNALATSGLVSKELDKKGEIKKKPTMTESKTLKTKRLIFKNTIFLNESQMLQRIPEEYKRDGQTIHMQDKEGNDYVVECVKSQTTGVIETNVINFVNEEKLNEQRNRIHELFNYDAKSTSGRNVSANQLNEMDSFKKFMDTARSNKQ